MSLIERDFIPPQRELLSADKALEERDGDSAPFGNLEMVARKYVAAQLRNMRLQSRTRGTKNRSSAF